MEPVSLSVSETADLRFMREEEKMARDVYLALNDAWGVAPFANIALSEQCHMGAMFKLVRTYRLADRLPVRIRPVQWCETT